MDKEEKEKLFEEIVAWYNTWIPGKVLADEVDSKLTEGFQNLNNDELNELIQKIKDEVRQEVKDAWIEASIKFSYSMYQTIREYNEKKGVLK